jgi:uncharacterized protein YraI
MRKGIRVAVAGLVAMALWCGWNSDLYAGEIWGETFGPVSATVDKGDTPQGLAIRDQPSAEGRVLGHLTVGTKIEGFRRFENGWMRIRRPSDRGWIPIDKVVPLSAEGQVRAADAPGCATVRSGPTVRFNTVGCVPLGKKVTLTGIWSENNWAQVRWPVRGWMYSDHVTARLKPEEPPVADYEDPSAVPPRYGYDTPGVPPQAYRHQPRAQQAPVSPYPSPYGRPPEANQERDNIAKRYYWGKDEDPTLRRRAKGWGRIGSGPYGVSFGADKILRFQIGGFGGWVDLKGFAPPHPPRLPPHPAWVFPQ